MSGVISSGDPLTEDAHNRLKLTSGNVILVAYDDGEILLDAAKRDNPACSSISLDKLMPLCIKDIFRAGEQYQMKISVSAWTRPSRQPDQSQVIKHTRLRVSLHIYIYSIQSWICAPSRPVVIVWTWIRQGLTYPLMCPRLLC